MTDDRSLERAARSWLETGPTQAPDPVVEAALLRIETTTQERDLRIPWRLPRMNTPARVAGAAVIGVLAIGGAYFAFRPDQAGVAGPALSPIAASPTVTSRPSPSPSPSPTVISVRALPESGPLTPGRYVLTMPDAPVDAEFTIGSGFPESGGWWVGGGISSISFWTVKNVYPDACNTAMLPNPPIGPTVDELVAALDAQANTDMSAPVDVVVDGHRGVRVELSPSDGLPDLCHKTMFLWESPSNPRTKPEGDPGRGIYREEPNEHVEPVWILDVDGERVVIVAYNSGHSAAAGDLTTPVMESMTLTKR